MDFKIGDLVGRKSYGCDIVFKVHDITKQNDGYVIILKGLNLRIIADAPEADIVKLPPSKINEDIKKYENRACRLMKKLIKKVKHTTTPIYPRLNRNTEQIFRKPGKVLHIDGDKNYLDICLKSYKELNIEAIGKVVAESEQPKVVETMLSQYAPDILVLTGHDAYIKGKEITNAEQKRKALSNLDNYRSSRYFIEAVKLARKYEASLDDLVIFAGACQSYFEGIMEAGANFGSSPERVLIHALDPVMVCEKIALTSIEKIVPLKDILTGTITGLDGIGGVQTRGKYRDGMPKYLYGSV